MSRGIGTITTAVISRAVNPDLSAEQARLTNLENNKVDKIEGKQLSTNDFTNELLAKVNTPYVKLSSAVEQAVDSELRLKKNLYVEGDIYLQGNGYTTEAETLRVSDNLIVTRAGATSAVTPYTGIKAECYDGKNSGLLVFDSTGTAYVGDEPDDGSLKGLQALATRTDSTAIADGGLAIWNNSTYPVLSSLSKGTEEQVLTMGKNTATGNLEAAWKSMSISRKIISFTESDLNWSEITDERSAYVGYWRYTLANENFYPLVVYKEYTDPVSGDIHYSEAMVQLEKKKNGNGVYFVTEKKITGVLIGF